MAVTSVTLTVSISRPAAEAFRFLADPATMSHWAIHNVKSIRPIGQNQWEIQTPRGAGRFIPHFEPSFGILDHEFIDPKEGSWQVAARIVSAGPNNSVYMITLVKPPSMPTIAFTQGIPLVEDELQTMKTILEQRR